MNKPNLAKLMIFLARLKNAEDHFDMRYYRGDGFEPCRVKNLEKWDPRACGTTACALGWAPEAGIPVGPLITSWPVYASKNFIDFYSPQATFMFSGTWGHFESGHDPRHAAARILYVLREKPVPTDVRDFREELYAAELEDIKAGIYTYEGAEA